MSDRPPPVKTDDCAREQALHDIVRLMRAHGVTQGELAEALNAGGVKATRGDIASYMFSILGAILIFAGIGVYIGNFWNEMNSAMRIAATLGSGLAVQAASLSLLMGGRYGRAVAPLLLIAIALQTAGWCVTIDELFPRGQDPRYAGLFVTGLMTLQQGAIFLRYRLTLLLFSVIAFAYAFMFILFDLMHAGDKLVMIGMGISMMALDQALRSTPHASLTQLGYCVGGAIFYIGLFGWLQHTRVELLFPVAVCGLIYVSAQARSLALLAVSTIAILCYIGYYTERHFVHSIGWPLSLVLLGIAFFGVSLMALRVKKQYL